MKLSLIVATDRQGGIGKDNQLPWHLPADLAHFKAVTLGKPVLMGRKTWESIGRPLPGRRNIVVSRSVLDLPEGVLHFDDLDAAIASQAGEEELMVIGGGQIYAETINQANCLYVTRVDISVCADAFFPKIDSHQWREVEAIFRAKDDKNPQDCTFAKFERRG
jgi:dihydrofolate reductase